MHKPESLYGELAETLHQIEMQISYVTFFAESQSLDPVALQHKDGTFVMTNLLLAKAKCLNGMALLRASTQDH